MSQHVRIYRMSERDISAVAEIHHLAFSRESNSEEWISCHAAAFPAVQCFVAKQDRRVLGYIIWVLRGGFRVSAVVELEQIAIHPDAQGKGIGSVLIERSFAKVEEQIAEHHGGRIKNVLITTRVDNNAAMRLYSKVLGAEAAALIPDLYSADEAVLIARRHP